jgi:hypothetical protein
MEGRKDGRKEERKEERKEGRKDVESLIRSFHSFRSIPTYYEGNLVSGVNDPESFTGG